MNKFMSQLKKKRLIAIVLVLVMVMSGLGVLASVIQPSITAPLSSPSSVINTNTNVSVIGSNNTTYTAKISISNSPSGNGYYQQEMVISNPSQYGINSNASNFYIAYPNGTLAYSWIQSINQGTQHNITVWSKLANGTSSVSLQVLPSFEDVLSATGYIGEAPQLSSVYAADDNGKLVFPFYENFASGILQGFTANNPQYLSFDNGLKILDGTSSLTVLSNISMGNSGTVLWNGEFNTGTASNSISQGSTAGDLYLGFQFTGNNANAFNWYNGTSNPYLIMYQDNGSSGSDANYFTNTYQNYMVQVNESSNDTQYMSSYLNNLLQQSTYTFNRNYSGNFGFFTQQTSVAYELWHYVAETSSLFTEMPTYSIGSAQPFLSNGTEITHQPYSIATQESYTYDIQDSFNYNYITVIYNPSWQLVYSSITANTTGTLPASMGGGSYMQFNDISGVRTIAITFLQPPSPSSSVSGTANLTDNISYYQYEHPSNKSIIQNIPVNENSTQTTTSFYGKYTNIVENGLNGTMYLNDTLGNYRYYENSTIGNTGMILSPLIFNNPETDYNYSSITSVYANLSVVGTNYESSWSFIPPANKENITYDIYVNNGFYILIYPSWTFPVGGNLNLSLNITVHAESIPGYNKTFGSSVYFNNNNYYYFASNDTNKSAVCVTTTHVYIPKTLNPQNLAYGFSSINNILLNPPDLTSYDFLWNSTDGTFNYSGIAEKGTSGNYTGIIGDNSFSYFPAHNETVILKDMNITFNFTYYKQIQAQHKKQTNILSSSEAFKQNQNYWNTSIAYSISNITAINNSKLKTTSGIINTTTEVTWIANITDVAYGTSPGVAIFSYNGYQTDSYSFVNDINQYLNITESKSQILGSGLNVDYNLSIFLNYYPAVSIPTMKFISNSTAQITFQTAESINEKEDIVIFWGDGLTTSLNNVSAGSFTENHTYSGDYTGSFIKTYHPYFIVTNIPMVLSGSLKTTSNSISYTITLTTNPTPDNVGLKSGQDAWMNYTQTGMNITSVSVVLNGGSYTPTHYAKDSYYISNSLIGKVAVTITWTMIAGSITDTQRLVYSTILFPSNESTYVTMEGSNSLTIAPHNSLISISNAPSGNGTYQQEFIFNDYSQYGINSAGSNFYINYANGTHAYSWIQSINSTSLVVWSKLDNGTTNAEIQTFSSSDNLLSATGYIGENSLIATGYDNGKLVFKDYTSFVGLSALPSGWTEEGSDESVSYSSNYINISGSTAGDFGGIVSTSEIPQNGSEYQIYGEFKGSTTSGGGYNMEGIFNDTSISSTSQYSYRGYVLQTGYGRANWYVFYDATSSFNTEYPQSNAIGLYSLAVINGTTAQFSHNNTQTPIITGITPSAHDFFGFVADGTSMQLSYYRVISYLSSMPTYTISIITPNPDYANSTSVGYIHYNSYSNDPLNLSDGEYTYNVPDSYNYNYLTIRYAQSWTFDYASTYNYITGNTTGGNFITFIGIKNINTLSFTLTEPITIGQPLGTLSLGAEPTVALDGNGFFNIPSGMISWDANGIPVSSSGFSVVVGKPVNLTAYGESGQPLQISQNGNVFKNYTVYTPTSYISYLPIYVNISSIQLNNLNSTDEVEVIATNSLGIHQDETLLSPYGTGGSSQTIYLPSGNYKFYYTQLNFTNGQIIHNKVATSEQGYSGMYWIDLSGFTIYQLGNQISYENSSIQKSIQTLDITVALNDSAIKNLTLGLSYNLSLQNTTLSSLNLSLSSKLNIANSILNSLNTTDTNNFTLINTAIKNLNLSENSYFGLLNNTISNLNLSQNSRFDIISNMISNLNLNQTDNYKILNNTMHTLNLNSTDYFTLLNNTINKVNLNQTNYYKLMSSAIDNVYNYTKSVANTTYGLHIESTSKQTILDGSDLNVSFEVYYHNYTIVPDNFLSHSSIQIIVLNQTGVIQNISYTETINNASLNVELIHVPVGNMTLRIIVMNNKYAGVDSYSFVSKTPVPVGLSLTIGVNSNLYSNTTITIPVYLYYSNGTRYNLSDTALLSTYTSLDIMNGSAIIKTYAPYNFTAGVINFKIGALPSGTYTFFITVSPVKISGESVNASMTQIEDLKSKPLTPLGSFEKGLSEFYSTIMTNLLATIIVSGGVVLATYFGRYLYRRINKKLKRDKADTKDVDNSLVASASVVLTDGDLNRNTDILTRYAKLSESQKTAFMRSPDGVLKNFPVEYLGKQTTLMDLRNKLATFNKKYDGKTISKYLKNHEKDNLSEQIKEDEKNNENVNNTDFTKKKFF